MVIPTIERKDRDFGLGAIELLVSPLADLFAVAKRTCIRHALEAGMKVIDRAIGIIRGSFADGARQHHLDSRREHSNPQAKTSDLIFQKIIWNIL